MYRQLKKDCLMFAEDNQDKAYFTIEQSVAEKITEVRIPNSSGQITLASTTVSWKVTNWWTL